MESAAEKTAPWDNVWRVSVATFCVAVLPLLAVYAFERATGLVSLWISGVLGVFLSAALAFAGAAAWRKYGSSDLVFSDLLIWGYVRRVWVERRLIRKTQQLNFALASATGELTRDERARMLVDFVSVMEATDPYTHGHSRRVTRHSYMIAKTMGLPKDLVERIRTASAVHDIGKLHIPNEILHKPDRLTEEEFAVIMEHAPRGADMVGGILDDEITAMVRHHHERIDGKGYPEGLKGGQIPLGARVIAVADTFDAITSTRPYRPAAKHKRAIEILKKEAGKQLDPVAVSAFLRYYSGSASIGWWATLTTIPQRLVASLLIWLRQAAVAGAVQTAAAVGTSVVLVTGIPAAPLAQSVAAASSSRAHALESLSVSSAPDPFESPSAADEAGAVRYGADPSPSPTPPRPTPSPSPSTSEPGSGSSSDPSVVDTFEGAAHAAVDSVLDLLPLP